MTSVVFTPGLDGHTIRFPYDPTVVAAIKATVPSYARSWNPHTRAWLIGPFWASVLADTLRCHGHTVTGLRSPPRYVHTDDSDWARMLFRRVGPNRAGPIFRSLSRILHPDVAGGDAQLQRELNLAHAELSQRKDDPAA